MEAIFGIVGIVLGWLLSEASQWWRSKKDEKRQKSAVRTLLSLEIDKNLVLLHEFWQQANKIKEDEAGLGPDAIRFRLASRLTNSPLPVWSSNVLESQMSMLPLALSDEKIVQIFELRSRLDNITVTYTTMSNLAAEKQMRPRDQDQGLWFNFSRFDSHAGELWDSFEQSVKGVLEKGNPLKV